MEGFGFSELLLIAVVILVFFGGNKIPEFMRGLGNGIREFNNAKNNMRMELQNGLKEKDNQSQQQQSSTNSNQQPEQTQNPT